MENLFPLFFILYIISTVVSAVLKKQRGETVRRVPPHQTQRDAPPARREPQPELHPELPPKPPAPNETDWPPLVTQSDSPREVAPPESSTETPWIEAYDETDARPRGVVPDEAEVPDRREALEASDLGDASPERKERSRTEDPFPTWAGRRSADGVFSSGSSRGVRLTPADVRRGILLAEILGPPRAMRPYSPPGLGTGGRRTRR